LAKNNTGLYHENQKMWNDFLRSSKKASPPLRHGDAARAAPSHVQHQTQTPKENAPVRVVCVGRRAATEKINKWMMQRRGEKPTLSNPAKPPI